MPNQRYLLRPMHASKNEIGVSYIYSTLRAVFHCHTGSITLICKCGTTLYRVSLSYCHTSFVMCIQLDLMGNVLGSGSGDSSSSPGSAQSPDRGQRRKRSLEVDPLSDEEVEELSPKRKKIVATSTYIYETLFKKGVNSDVTISALGQLGSYLVLKMTHRSS